MQKQNKHNYGGYMKLSNLIGKQVFCVYDANILGTIHDVAFDDKYTKILGIYFFDQEENEYFLKSKNIFYKEDYHLFFKVIIFFVKKKMNIFLIFFKKH